MGREYQRDLGRFLRGENPAAPELPENYFDRVTEDRLRAAADSLDRTSEIIGHALPLSSWRSSTVRLFANWLAGVAAARARRETSRAVPTRKRA